MLAERWANGRHWLLPLGLALGVVALGLVGAETYAADVAASGFALALMTLSWTTFCGPAKEINFGHGLFVGGAAYLVALSQVQLGFPPWVAFILGPLGGAALGCLTALVTYRHRGVTFSMLTMALQLAFFQLLFVHSELFGGEEGVFGVASFATTRTSTYWLAAGALVIAYLAARRFMRSGIGLQLAAVGQDELYAEGLGVDVGRTRLAGLALSGALAGLAGTVLVMAQSHANAELASDQLSVQIVVLALLGGLWSLEGSVLVALGMTVVHVVVSDASSHSALIYATLMLALLVAFSRGLVTARPRWASRPVPDHATRIAAGGEGLRVERLTVGYDGLFALDGLELALSPGRIIGIVGPNGAGKSTLLDVISGRRAPSAGGVSWAGRPLGRVGTAARVRHGVVKFHQHASFFPELTLDEHLAVVQAACRSRTPDRAIVSELLALARPPGLAPSAPVADFPLAHARLLGLALALATAPDLLMLDEPLAGLSGEQADRLTDIVRRAAAGGMTVLIVEHRLRELLDLVDEVAVLVGGRVVVTASPRELLDDPRLMEAYLPARAAGEGG